MAKKTMIFAVLAVLFASFIVGCAPEAPAADSGTGAPAAGATEEKEGE
jgi:hypothetical protein